MKERSRASVVISGGTQYFLAVFACGFLLGIVRTLWLAPRVGERWAELIEIPIMVLVIYLAATWISRRFALGTHDSWVRGGVGALGLVLLLAAELGFVLKLRGLPLADYVESRDPISGTAYALSLLLFAAMPVVVSRRRGGARNH